LPERQVARVYHKHVGKGLRGQAGVVVAGRKAGAQADVHNGVEGLREGGKHVEILPDADGSGGAQLAAGVDVCENVVRGDVGAVGKGHSVLDDVQGYDGNDVPLYELGGQVAGAVRRDFNIHEDNNSRLQIAAQGGSVGSFAAPEK